MTDRTWLPTASPRLPASRSRQEKNCQNLYLSIVPRPTASAYPSVRPSVPRSCMAGIDALPAELRQRRKQKNLAGEGKVFLSSKAYLSCLPSRIQGSDRPTDSLSVMTFLGRPMQPTYYSNEVSFSRLRSFFGLNKNLSTQTARSGG